MSQPRHRRKRSLFERDGSQVRVTRQLATGEAIEYDAILRIEADGRAMLEKIKFLHACARLGAYEMFRAALDVPVFDHPDWLKISGAYVQVGFYTTERQTGRNMTRVVMDNFNYAA